MMGWKEGEGVEGRGREKLENEGRGREPIRDGRRGWGGLAMRDGGGMGGRT